MVSDNTLPVWIKRYMRQDGPERVAAAVREVEKTTSGEIVPMVVARSSVTGHVFPLLLLLLLALFLAVDLAIAPASLYGGNAVLGGVSVAVLTAGAWVFSRFPQVQRWLTADADLAAQVLRRAALEFYEAGLNKTAGATGILLFVSLAERRAVVLADRSIAERLPPETWNDVIELVIKGIHSEDLGAGLVAGLDRCGAVVAPHFPVQPGDVNELADALIIKE